MRRGGRPSREFLLVHRRRPASHGFSPNIGIHPQRANRTRLATALNPTIPTTTSTAGIGDARPRRTRSLTDGCIAFTFAIGQTGPHANRPPKRSPQSRPPGLVRPGGRHFSPIKAPLGEQNWKIINVRAATTCVTTICRKSPQKSPHAPYRRSKQHGHQTSQRRPRQTLP